MTTVGASPEAARVARRRRRSPRGRDPARSRWRPGRTRASDRDRDDALQRHRRVNGAAEPPRPPLRGGAVRSAGGAADRYFRGAGPGTGDRGDSFFVVFSSAADAVACCAAAQRALAGYEWPGGVAVRVRMGLHTGEPSRHQEGYIGIDVHRAARIAAAAHGGQVVMSTVTWQLARPGLPAELSAGPGSHRLKDIEEPERIFQLAGAWPARGSSRRCGAWARRPACRGPPPRWSGGSPISRGCARPSRSRTSGC